MSPSIDMDWMAAEGIKLANCRHDNPFGVLGPQPNGDKWRLSIWMPEANEVNLLLDAEEKKLTNPNHPWIFETILEENPGSSYQINVQRGGISHKQYDPWAFRSEWMGEIDRHLFAEGNHHHIWRRMGAHMISREEVQGVMFCLWAPNAKSISVIAEINSWDGRHHPMQKRLGGIWELFIPGLEKGDLYKDYLRPEGEWIPNEDGSNQNYEAVNFLQQANHVLFQHFPGALSIAEESTTWSGVTKPTEMGGLGFNLKWNMGWMHDMLDYFEIDPWFRQFHQNNVTFSICYNYTENFMLSLSHDEVVHGKSHLLHKMPGDDWKKYANTRALLAYMWTHPGKKTIFMGMEFGQRQEWNVWDDMQWELLEHEPHKGIQRLIDDLNSLYKEQPALWRDDFDEYGFQWIDCKDSSNSVISFMRRERETGEWLVVIANFTPELHSNYKIGVPIDGFYKEIFNTDSDKYGGSNKGNLGGKYSEKYNIHEYENALELSLPPLSVLILKYDENKAQAKLKSQ